MKSYDVNKNLEREPRIQGFKPNYYYLLFVLQIAFALVFFIWALFALGNPTATGLTTYFVAMGISLTAILFMRKQFKKLSNQTKFRFGTKRSVLSNKDILNQI